MPRILLRICDVVVFSKLSPFGLELIDRAEWLFGAHLENSSGSNRQAPNLLASVGDQT